MPSLASAAAALLAALPLAACAARPPAAEVLHAQALRDWQDLRFGMFVHWGPVSLKGTEIGWSRGKQVPREEYDALYRGFSAERFDARAWARTAREAGMRYLVLTSKHHDGFCLWDSRETDHTVMHSPLGRDVVAELAEACREEGLGFGLYYSILDWYQPDYNTAGVQGGPGFSLPDGCEPDMDRFQAYVQAQLRELHEAHGPLLTFWFDGEWEAPWTEERGARLLAFCRDLSPTTLVNNRVGKSRQGMAGTTAGDGPAPGDYDTPEQTIGAFNDQRPWETCMTLCRQWAWKPDDALKSLEECVRTLVRTAGGDGNLLLNVGPMPDGRIEPRQVERLRQVGAWLERNGGTIHGTRGGPFLPGSWGASTHRGREVYVHVFEWEGPSLTLPPLPTRILSAALLHGGEASFLQTDQGVTLSVPPSARDGLDTIVVLQLAEAVPATGPPPPAGRRP